ncbi:MAG: LysR family transcriptional regulator [Thalassovita sp.]
MNDKRHLRNIDLNLLVVFDMLYRERHVTRSASKLGMSQPAVSNALQRLRQTLQDDLLIKTPTGMQATDRAIELAGPIRSIVTELEGLFAHRHFDPATAEDEVNLATVDYFNVALLPGLTQILNSQAPNMTLRVVPTNGRSYELLDLGEADLTFASFDDPPARFDKCTLRSEGYACILRRDHPSLTQGLTAQHYAELRHILHSPSGDVRGATDAALADQGLRRHIALTVSSFLHAETILSTTDMIMTAPVSVTNRLAQNPALCVVPCPVEVKHSAQRLDMLWHRQFGNRPVIDWLRTKIQSLVDPAPQPPVG